MTTFNFDYITCAGHGDFRVAFYPRGLPKTGHTVCTFAAPKNCGRMTWMITTDPSKVSSKWERFRRLLLSSDPNWEFGELSLVSYSEIVSRVSSISRLNLGWTFHESVQVKSTQGPRVKRRVSSTSDGGAESVGMYE